MGKNDQHYEKIWKKIEKNGKIQKNKEKYGKLWKIMENYGKLWKIIKILLKYCIIINFKVKNTDPQSHPLENMTSKSFLIEIHKITKSWITPSFFI